MRKILLAILAAISLVSCVLLVLVYARVISSGSGFPPQDIFTVHWYARGPTIQPHSPLPERPDDTKAEDVQAAMAGLFSSIPPTEDVLVDHSLLRLSRIPADDEGKQPMRWQYVASAPILSAIPLAMLLPTWWYFRHFRTSAYCRRNAKVRDSHLGARLITTSLAFILCTGVVVAHSRGSVFTANHGRGWSAPFGVLIGVDVLDNSAMLQWYWFLRDDNDPVIRAYSGKWFGEWVTLTYARRAHSTDFLIFFPMFIVDAVAGLLLLRTGQHLYREFRRVRRGNKGLCLQCGYDLRSSQERCPECGTAIPAEMAKRGNEAGTQLADGKGSS